MINIIPETSSAGSNLMTVSAAVFLKVEKTKQKPFQISFVSLIDCSLPA